MIKKIHECENNRSITIQFSDVRIRENRIKLPPDIAGEYQLSSISELYEIFNHRSFIEINVSGIEINMTDALRLFLKENEKGFEIHRLFDVSDSQSDPMYLTSFLISI